MSAADIISLKLLYYSIKTAHYISYMSINVIIHVVLTPL